MLNATHRRQHPTRPQTGRLALAIVAAALALAAASPAAADGTITGRIISEATNQPLAGMCGVAFGDVDIIGSPPTGSDGIYRITGLYPGKWEVVAADCVGDVEYSPMDYNNIRGLNRNLAQFVELKREGQERRAINFKMPRAGYIFVQVLDSVPPFVPISGVLVCPFWHQVDRKGNIFQSSFCEYTNSDGEVVLDVTAGGNKLLWFTSLASGWYDDAAGFDEATVVNVPAGNTLTVTIYPNPVP